MILQVELQDLRRMIKEKCEEIISDKKLAYEFYLRICGIEDDDRFTIAEMDELKEQSTTEFFMDEYQPTCKACGFRPFAGYIPTLEWMKEYRFNFCPRCGKKVKWK